jgi:hypothetical protein
MGCPRQIGSIVLFDRCKGRQSDELCGDDRGQPNGFMVRQERCRSGRVEWQGSPSLNQQRQARSKLDLLGRFMPGRAGDEEEEE